MKEVKEIKNLKEILTDICEKFSDRVAILEKYDPKNNYTEIKYSKLKEDTVALGTAMLKKLNLEGEKIAVLGENSYKWGITYLATVCGIGTIVPLDKELPVNEIENLLTRSKAKAIIYSEKRKDKIEQLIGKIDTLKYFINMNIDNDSSTTLSFDKLIEEGKEIVNAGNDEYINLPVDTEKMSILLFTSGTTAQSKGVMLCHKNICANINSALEFIHINEEDRFFSVLPIHHTYECSEGFLLPLSQGSSIAYAEGLKTISKNIQETTPSIILAVPLLVETLYKRIWDNIKKQGKDKLITKMIKITNSTGKTGEFLKKILFKKVHKAFGGKLRYIVSGAAALDSNVAKGLQDLGFAVLQGYGLTETSPLVSVSPEKCIKYASVGLPVKCNTVKIDNPNEEGIGEIIVNGDNVMLGYYENEEENKKVLIDNWFHTGDMGYIDKDGYIYITGRLKTVIVTQNGKKIFPEELESILNKYEIIKESLVYGIPDPKDERETLVAAKIVIDKEYVDKTYGDKGISEQEKNDIIKDTIKEVNQGLVHYKAIRHFEIREEEFEKTTTMKIKRYSN